MFTESVLSENYYRFLNTRLPQKYLNYKPEQISIYLQNKQNPCVEELVSLKKYINEMANNLKQSNGLLILGSQDFNFAMIQTIVGVAVEDVLDDSPSIDNPFFDPENREDEVYNPRLLQNWLKYYTAWELSDIPFVSGKEGYKMSRFLSEISALIIGDIARALERSNSSKGFIKELITKRQDNNLWNCVASSLNMERLKVEFGPDLLRFLRDEFTIIDFSKAV